MSSKTTKQHSVSITDKNATESLILRPHHGFPMIRREAEQLTVNRRRFITSAAVATAGVLMIRPLYVEAKWWSSLLDFFKNFAQGILFNALGQILPGGLGNASFFNNMRFLPDGSGSFSREQATPGDSVKSFVQKILTQVGNSAIDTAFAYVQKWLDRSRNVITNNLRIPYLNGPAMTSLGEENLVTSYLAKYAGANDDFKSSLMLPTFQGQLIDPAISRTLLSAPPDFVTKFAQAHEMESGTIIAVTYEPQNIVRDRRGVVDRGQGQSVLYIVPSARSENPNLRRRYKNVRDYINGHSNYWTNQEQRADFINVVLKSNSVIQPQEQAFDFQNVR